MNDFVLLSLIGLLLFSGCLSEINSDEKFCVNQNGKFSYSVGWNNDNFCNFLQEDGKYKRYLIVDTNTTVNHNWILVEE